MSGILSDSGIQWVDMGGRRVWTRPDANGWQPIETAPKDGTQVLIYEADEEYPISVAEWGICGWILANFDPGYDLTQRPVRATHWMPLPNPPIDNV